MKTLKLALVFISFYVLRWVSLRTVLPPTWTPESKVRFTATILERPEYTDTNTIVRIGVWYINLRGYAEIIPGSRVSFAGKVEPKVLGNKITRIVMKDPTFEIISDKYSTVHSPTETFKLWLFSIRTKWESILDKWLPRPMSNLAAGILLGIQDPMPSDFYTALVSTGTLHIVAASGYNVSIVASLIVSLSQAVMGRATAIALGVLGIVVYVILAGAGASVVRAGIMGSLTIVAFYFGRPSDARRLLWIAGGVMLLIDPLMIVDIGFQLSFMATLGLLYLEPLFKRLPRQAILSEYLYPTLAATGATLPIIWYHFGRVSWVSPLVNMLVTPAVPMIMGLSALVIVVGVIVPGIGQIIAWVLYPLLWYMVEVIRWWG